MASNNAMLEQMLEAALRGGGLRGGGGAAQGGNLNDILGGMLGGAQGAGQALPGNQAAPGGPAGGSLEDILGSILGGAQGAGRGSTGGAPNAGGASAGAGPSPGGGSLGDILGSILGGGPAGGGGAAGGGGGSSGYSDFSDVLREFGNGPETATAGGAAASPSAAGGTGTSDSASGRERRSGRPPMPEASAGGANPSMPTGSAPTPSSPASPEMQAGGPMGGGMNDLIKYGGMAVFAMLAYKALRNWQEQRGAEAQKGGAASAMAAPSASGFNPGQVPGGAEALSGVLVKAMVAATQADGVIDENEQRGIIGRLGELGRGGIDPQALTRQLTTRIDPRELVSAATTPEIGLEIYAASVMAISIDTPQERQYLDGLAGALGIDPGLKSHVEQMLGRA